MGDTAHALADLYDQIVHGKSVTTVSEKGISQIPPGSVTANDEEEKQLRDTQRAAQSTDAQNKYD
jgi:hypothetical protein